MKIIPPNFTSAEKDYKRAIELAPLDYNGYDELAKLYIVQERYKDAINVLSDGLKKVSKASPLFLKRAGVYAIMGRQEEAVKDLKKILELKVFNIEDRNSFWNISEDYVKNILKDLSDKNKQKEAMRMLTSITMGK